MAAVGESLRAARVAVVYLVHGTFVGADALGLLTSLARLAPGAAQPLLDAQKALADRLAGEYGNYTLPYAQLLEQSLAGDGPPTIQVRRFLWSSENHHIARADGAVRLLDDLASLRLEPGARALLWGHSHAGNVFALATQLLAQDADRLRSFFRAGRTYYRSPLLGRIDAPVWDRVERMLTAGGLLRENPLDVVTFGTPIRYGWSPPERRRLLHFVHHHPVENLPSCRAPFPPATEAVTQGSLGDVVQHLGIAGTNLPPSVFALRTWLADRRMGRLLERELARESLWARLQHGARIHEAGETLLVDYGPQPQGFARHLAGHAVYTLRDWMLFHAEQVVASFYPQNGGGQLTDYISDDSDRATNQTKTSAPAPSHGEAPLEDDPR